MKLRICLSTIIKECLPQFSNISKHRAIFRIIKSRKFMCLGEIFFYNKYWHRFLNFQLIIRPLNFDLNNLCITLILDELFAKYETFKIHKLRSTNTPLYSLSLTDFFSRSCFPRHIGEAHRDVFWCLNHQRRCVRDILGFFLKIPLGVAGLRV